ncbi:MAG: amidohydrolase, partial [Myxococcales bacterium]|nr:amidohydrolase [Myxococcales bacterium]
VTAARSADAVGDAVRAALPGAAGWIRGRGWDQTRWAHDAFPDHRPLTAAAPHRPVCLRRVDGHAVWANAAAMAAAGVGAQTPDPPGGLILRDAAGQPTGVFLDEAMALVERAAPAPTDGEVTRWVRSALGALHRAGITGVHDPGATAQMVRVYRQLAAQGELPLRVHVLLDDNDPAIAPLLAAGPAPDPWVAVRGVKLFSDGALGSCGAWLHHPYSDRPDQTGIPIVVGAALRAKVRAHGAAGFQLAVHAIGDRAATEVLDAFEAAGVTPAHRWRIEHAQIVRPLDQARMARLGVLGLVQPTHATSDHRWATARLGARRVRTAYAWQSMARAGVRLALGSDCPIEAPAAVAGLVAAVTRRDAQGPPPEGWLTSEALSRRDALWGFTVGSAYAGFTEHRRGRVAVGFDADLTALSGDPLDPLEDLAALQVRGVCVGGVWHPACEATPA